MKTHFYFNIYKLYIAPSIICNCLRRINCFSDVMFKMFKYYYEHISLN